MAADPDASTSFTWTLEGDDMNDFTINQQGELRLLSVPDYESPTDSDTNNGYNVTVRVTDGSLSVTSDFVLTIGNVNEAPRIVTGTTGAAFRRGQTRHGVTRLLQGRGPGCVDHLNVVAGRR